MRLLVTGATSFLGADFVRAAAAAGHEVTALARRRTAAVERAARQVIERDILAVEDADLAGGYHAVVHFATGSEGSEEHIVRVAVDGTLRLFQAARAASVPRFVHISSMSVYGGPMRRDHHVRDQFALERHPARRGAYARSKTLADAALQAAAREARNSATEVTIVRPGLVFGPDMKVPLAGTAAALPLGLMFGMGRPGQAVPFVTVQDLSAGLVALIESPPRPGPARIFDVLSGAPPTKRAFIALYRTLTGQPCRTVWLPRWIALPVGYTADVLFALRGRRPYAGYKLKRMYGFEPAALPRDKFWVAIGRAPTGVPRAALAEALTIDRAPALPAGEPAYRAKAVALLATAAGSPADARGAVVLVGAGRVVADLHVAALQGLRNIDVRAVVDPNRALAEETAAHLHGARAVADIGALEDKDLDGAAAVIATPGYSHAAIAQALLARGASVLIEKPATMTGPEFDAVARAARAAGRPASVFHNYRLRPNALRLWRFLADHDVGARVRADVTFVSPPLAAFGTRWMQEEKRNRVLLFEQAIHFIDLVAVVGGPLASLGDVARVDRRDGLATVSIGCTGRTADGASVSFHLDLAGTAARTQIAFEFERAACVLDFYPEGFRVLPRKATPIDDLGAAAARLAQFAGQAVRKRRHGMARRALPHAYIYRAHLAAEPAAAESSPFALAGVADTMRTLFMIAAAAYGDAPALRVSA
jgi:nucleoside-diphosphate-sugar epimerase